MNVNVLVTLVILICALFCIYMGELIELIPFLVIGFLYFIFKIIMFVLKRIAIKLDKIEEKKNL